LTPSGRADTFCNVRCVAVIPARYASSRFPGKPLARETGKFLIQHVYEQARRATRLSDVIIATDDQRIVEAAESFGASARLTRGDHPSGTDRVAEVAAELDADILLNIQGDEPELSPAHIDGLIDQLAGDPEADMATLACRFESARDVRDPNQVKVVVDSRGRALYFSRLPIPYSRDGDGDLTPPGEWLLHLGIYAYRRETLLALAKLAPTPLETKERLEQLRALEHGYAISVAVVDHAAPGIDTPADYAAFVKRTRAKKST
jgi:3-deoxy-manno-octulosonate cytidylyltransferase (CMP-KDO synthetase)